MTDDLSRRLRAARPDTHADDGWAATAEGAAALVRIRRTAGDGSDLRLRLALPMRRQRPVYAFAITAGVALVAVAFAASGTDAPARTSSAQHAPLVVLGSPVRPAANGPAAKGPTVKGPGSTGPIAAARSELTALVSYPGCGAVLDGLRSHAAASVSQDGLPGQSAPIDYGVNAPALVGTAHVATSAAAGSSSSRGVAPAPAHSGTNDQQAGADEPDIVKSDGTRIVSISGGVLRVIDTATRRVTGTLDLGLYAGADAAQLLVAGNRALVLMGGGQIGNVVYPTASVATPATSTRSTYLLVDLTAQPKVISAFRPKGSYVDARLISGRVRLVVANAPDLQFPSAHPSRAANQAVIRRAPLAAWQPGYDVITNGVSTSHKVPCQDISHPASYTGASLVTVYTIDPAAGFDGLEPVSLAADAASVYATTSSLYLTSEAAPDTVRTSTQLHRFDIRGTERPAYVGSVTVPGSLLSSYSLSEYDGSLRVVTTSGQAAVPDTALYVFDAATLRQTGSVRGLGQGQQVYAVRLDGPLGYVVTFRSVDPLYVLDLRDPRHPRTAGELHIAGYSSYLHPTSSGRLLGVGQQVRNGIVQGVQVSLFDVADPARPSRLARVVVPHTPDEDVLDPHAFLYWAATDTAVVPIESYDGGAAGRVLVLRVEAKGLHTLGTVANPGSSDDGGIQRSLVVGDELWTMSAAGFAVSGLSTLHREGWIAFS